MTLRFGTDGIRGLANAELTPELTMAIGQAAAQELGNGHNEFVIGRDTRRSGLMLQAALSAGLASAGMNVIDIGVLPTPGIAFTGTQMSAPAAVISASHNPFSDNGIKFFQSDGRKLADDVEERFEAVLQDVLHRSVSQYRTGADVGVLSENNSAHERYAEHLQSTVPDGALQGMRIVLDCANGAASSIAPSVFRSLGAEITVLNDAPDGCNINANCGSTHLEGLQEVVIAEHAQCGFAFDGDADRVLSVDHTGVINDGDHLIAILAMHMKQRGELVDNTAVITVMANLGLKLAMKAQAIDVYETAVGDRYVLDALEAHRWTLGGEQSGHIILPRHATTGDGVLAALQIAAIISQSGSTLHELGSVVTKLPQVLKNVRVENRDALRESSVIHDALELAERQLGEHGRVLLRPSGTEPLVRVMVEAPTAEQAEAICAALCVTVEKELRGR